MTGLRFGRDAGTIEAGFIPGEDHEVQPLGSAESQYEEAMALAKDRNRREQSTESILPYIQKMDDFPNISAAVEWLDGQSQFIREKYLEAEKLSKNRKTLLAYYGWN